MVEINIENWLQEYNPSLVLVLRCGTSDKPEFLSMLEDAAAQVGGLINQVDPVKTVSGQEVYDITVCFKNKGEIEKLLEMIKPSRNFSIVHENDKVLEMHDRGVIQVISKLPIRTQIDLRRVYTPGVASVCELIDKDPSKSSDYTTIYDRVAIITNGTAVLGLGDIGPVASMPVMEGKAAILAEFVDLSGIPILLDTKDVDSFVNAVALIAPSFGLIQLEDVAAPACFEIEQELSQRLDIPVFHDDQHGTATVVLAALISALDRVGKSPEECSVLMLGAGAAGCAVSLMLKEFGIGDIVLYDSKGPIYRGRTEYMNQFKDILAEKTNKNNQNCTFAEAFAGKDIFIGLSRPNVVTKEMVSAMNKNAIVFPLSNPVGEISKEDAVKAGAIVVADGRDVNNALAYPGLFRGALDAKAKEINMDMKVAAAKKLAKLAPSKDLLPDILDKNVHRKVAEAVANAWKKGAQD